MEMLMLTSFWLALGGAFICWYLLAVWIARILFNSEVEPLVAARRAPWIALGILLASLGAVAWFWLPEPTLFLAVALLSVVVVVLCLLSWLDPIKVG